MCNSRLLCLIISFKIYINCHPKWTTNPVTQSFGCGFTCFFCGFLSKTCFFYILCMAVSLLYLCLLVARCTYEVSGWIESKLCSSPVTCVACLCQNLLLPRSRQNVSNHTLGRKMGNHSDFSYSFHC